MDVVCSSRTSEKIIAISFDDGPDAHSTPQILKILNDYAVESVFFCIGKRIKGNENIIRQIISDGHVIGNHSYSHHFWFDLFSSKRMLKDMQNMDNEINSITGLTPILFRPPYGVTNPNLATAVTEGNYIAVGWSVRSMDTVTKSEEKLMKKITSNIHPGAIYLFHDTSATTLAVLPSFLEFVKESGYKIVRLDKMLHLNSYA